MISLIAAVASNRVIGARGALPWHLPRDLAHFKRTTLGQTIIMGRKTHESIARKLPDRENLVVTSNPHLVAAGCKPASSLQAALEAASMSEKIIIGGATLYAEALPLTEVLYLTRVHANVEGDTYFPALDLSQWQESSSEHFDPDDQHAHAFTIATLTRRLTPRPPQR